MGDTQHATRLLRALEAMPVKDRASLKRRLQWYYTDNIKFDPIFAHVLDDSEIELLANWFRDTNDAPYIGETSFQGISFLASLIISNNVVNVVQLGHYAGFSSLVMGLLLRKKDSSARLISFDIDDRMTRYCEMWTERAGLTDSVMHVCADSTDPATLEYAEWHLTGRPDLLYIDASKQYQNTIAEVTMWAPFLHGYVVAHDVSDVAKGSQAAGALGVSDGLADAEAFAPHELLLLDPKWSVVPDFPYRDPMGLGIGILRGTQKLPAADAQPIHRRVLGSGKLRTPENWQLQSGFKIENGVLTKSAGAPAWANCFAPLIGEREVVFEIEVRNSEGSAMMICGGGAPGTGATIQGDGRHTGSFMAGSENSFIAIFAPAESRFQIAYLQITDRV
jgi:predicted O-methyltransferase YrrM